MSAIEVVSADCLVWMQSQTERIVNLTITSPPYEDARTYGIGFNLKGQKWVDWCIPRIVEMCRLTDGLVIFNAAGKRRNWMYSPVMEWLVTDLTRQHGIVCGPAPYVYHRIGIPEAEVALPPEGLGTVLRFLSSGPTTVEMVQQHCNGTSRKVGSRWRNE